MCNKCSSEEFCKVCRPEEVCAECKRRTRDEEICEHGNCKNCTAKEGFCKCWLKEKSGSVDIMSVGVGMKGVGFVLRTNATVVGI
jgi:hypothetical protein